MQCLFVAAAQCGQISAVDRWCIKPDVVIRRLAKACPHEHGKVEGVDPAIGDGFFVAGGDRAEEYRVHFCASVDAPGPEFVHPCKHEARHCRRGTHIEALKEWAGHNVDKRDGRKEVGVGQRVEQAGVGIVRVELLRRKIDGL